MSEIEAAVLKERERLADLIVAWEIRHYEESGKGLLQLRKHLADAVLGKFRTPLTDTPREDAA